MKPILIYGPGRSGTTLLICIVKAYLTNHVTISENDYHNQRISENDEYFNLSSIIIDDGLKLRQKFSSLEEEPQFENNLNEIKRRIKLLQRYKNQKMPIKIPTCQMTDLIFDYVKKEYRIVIIERNDIYDQVLSIVLAKHTDVWNVSKDKPLSKPPKFVAELKKVDHFVQKQIIPHQKWKRKFLDEGTVIAECYYEELNSKNNFEYIIKKIGLKYDNRNILYLSKKLYSLEEKEKIIVNFNEIKEHLKKMNIVKI